MRGGMVKGKRQGNAPQWELLGVTGEVVHLELWVWDAASVIY